VLRERRKGMQIALDLIRSMPAEMFEDIRDTRPPETRDE